MMLGTLAQRGGVVQGQPEWLPVGATAFLDFVTGVYYAGGASRNVTDLLGGGFDVGAISAAGLHFIFTNANRPIVRGTLFTDLAASLAAGCTTIMDCDFKNTAYGYLMFFGNEASFDASTDVLVVAADDDMFDSVSLGVGSTIGAAGLHKVAFTINRDVGGGSYEYAWSVDGAAAATQTVTYALSWTLNTVAIGHSGNGDDVDLLDDVYIRSITIYPAKMPADLPALSA